MMNLPSLRQLQYLIALHTNQHFSKAAKACHISQSTLSAGIAQLEQTLDCQLLERSHKSFIFTTLGEQVVKDAKALIQSSTDLLQFTRSHNKPMTGKIILGCIPTIAPFVLSDIAKTTAAQYPQLELMLTEDTSENLLKALSEGVIDMVILAMPYKVDGFSTAILADDHFTMVIHKDTADDYTSNEISRLPDKSIFLMKSEHCLSEHIKSMCNVVEKVKINPFLATSLQTLVQMVNSQQAVTFLPQMALNSDILHGTELIRRRVEVAGAHRKIGLLWRKTNKRVTTFVNLAMIIGEVVRTKCKR